jgi:hypothetical protein
MKDFARKLGRKLAGAMRPSTRNGLAALALGASTVANGALVLDVQTDKPTYQPGEQGYVLIRLYNDNNIPGGYLEGSVDNVTELKYVLEAPEFPIPAFSSGTLGFPNEFGNDSEYFGSPGANWGRVYPSMSRGAGLLAGNVGEIDSVIDKIQFSVPNITENKTFILRYAVDDQVTIEGYNSAEGNNYSSFGTFATMTYDEEGAVKSYPGYSFEVVVPEPSTALLVGAGALGLSTLGSRKRRTDAKKY